ncbi:COMM domain-containing protein 10 isoform X1 [Grus americana]|uniref:COMM domain-containing protein 10 isoform X1 n=1 Tax=Grus americana TaxID=9117 RepID=UPI00240789CB|nr:COMM domain-containing protein 10 isoform X1 [Grus americana]
MAAPVVPESDSIRRAVSLLNAVDPGRFPRLVSRLLQKLHVKAESSFSEDEEEKLQIAFSLEKQDLHLVLETISFILEQAVYHNLKPASLQQQLQNIHLDEDKAEAFASAWAAAGQDTIEKFRQRVLTPQKLETIGWQLNLQMAESMQAKLKSPQAMLELGLSNEDSKENKLWSLVLILFHWSFTHCKQRPAFLIYVLMEPLASYLQCKMATMRITSIILPGNTPERSAVG